MIEENIGGYLHLKELAEKGDPDVIALLVDQVDTDLIRVKGFYSTNGGGVQYPDTIRGDVVNGGMSVIEQLREGGTLQDRTRLAACKLEGFFRGEAATNWSRKEEFELAHKIFDMIYPSVLQVCYGKQREIEISRKLRQKRGFKQ